MPNICPSEVAAAIAIAFEELADRVEAVRDLVACDFVLDSLNEHQHLAGDEAFDVLIRVGRMLQDSRPVRYPTPRLDSFIRRPILDGSAGDN